VHWVTMKHVLRHLRGTLEYGLRYLGGDGVRMHGYSDSDWVGSAIDRNSTSRCCFSLGSTMITWFNKKRTSIALSSVETEYLATSMATCESIWLHKFLTGLFDHELEPTMIYCDNQTFIKLFENLLFHDRIICNFGL